MQNTNKDFWEDRWSSQQTSWDLGSISPPIKQFVDGLTTKTMSILIPGCGNAHEAEYLLQQRFTNITVIDIAPTLTEALKIKLNTFVQNSSLTVLCGDFFEHHGQYDLILEQTFFCAINPSLRKQYAHKMYELLSPKGKVVGLLFNKQFEGGPPFGGNTAEYETYFNPVFATVKMEHCVNSAAPRMGSEIFIELSKK